MDDVYASTSGDLVEQYGRGLINDLLRFAEGRDRARLVDAFETWKGGGPLHQDAKELLWSKVVEAAATPPDDPAEIVRIIKEDRAYREGRVLRSIGIDARSSAITPVTKRKEREMNDEVVRKRVDENSIITVRGKLDAEGNPTRENPKRAGSLAYDRFALYEDGMTVKEAKEAGVSATDITYDSSHGYITLTPGEAPAETEGDADAETEGEEAPKKKKKKAA
jgi:hypothetical protein